MNKETLKRDLASRLMDGVKVFVRGEEDLFDLIGLSQMTFFEVKKPIWGTRTEEYEVEDVFPYLFPADALTKPIQIASYNNGEPFVPIEEMRKLSSSMNDYLFIDALEDDLSNIDIRVQNAPFVFVEFFNQTHINYRLSPNQFIEVTEQNNPYK